jgi:hypothetical protein
MVNFSDILDAFSFVSGAGYGMNSAILCKDTGKILYRSGMGNIDEIADEDLDPSICIGIPHKNELDLGESLVFEFVEAQMPDLYDNVQQMFRRQGAYGRFKDLLERKGLLEGWYAFESRREEQELRRWCIDNEIQLSS